MSNPTFGYISIDINDLLEEIEASKLRTVAGHIIQINKNLRLKQVGPYNGMPALARVRSGPTNCFGTLCQDDCSTALKTRVSKAVAAYVTPTCA